MRIAGLRKGWIVLFGGLLGASSLSAAAQQPSLTLRQAIDRALGRNPEIAAAKADAQSAGAGATLARTGLFPTFNFTEDISRGNDPVYVFGTRLRQQQFTQSDFALNSLNKPAPVGDFVTRFNGSWRIFDWFETQQQMKGAKLAAGSATAVSDAVEQATVLRVVEAYQSILFAQRRIDVAQHEQTTAQALLADAKANVKAGLAVDSDTLAAQVNLSEREQELIAAQGEMDIAWARLETAMGSAMPVRPALTPIEARNYPDGVLSEEIASALKMRPDLHALEEQQRAQAAATKAARDDFGPKVSAYGNWEMDRSSFVGNGGNNWVAGVQLTMDILPMGKRSRLAQEEAAREKAAAQERTGEDQIRLAVRRAYSQHVTAERIVATAQSSMRQATESLRIMRNRYKAGLTTMTDLLRAEDARRLSQTDYWQAVYGNTMAYAELLYATGALTPDSAENLQ